VVPPQPRCLSCKQTCLWATHEGSACPTGRAECAPKTPQSRGTRRLGARGTLPPLRYFFLKQSEIRNGKVGLRGLGANSQNEICNGQDEIDCLNVFKFARCKMKEEMGRAQRRGKRWGSRGVIPDDGLSCRKYAEVVVMTGKGEGEVVTMPSTRLSTERETRSRRGRQVRARFSSFERRPIV